MLVNLGRFHLHWGYRIDLDHRYGVCLGWRLKDYQDLPKGSFVAQWLIEFSCNLPRICKYYYNDWRPSYDSSRWTGRRAADRVFVAWDRHFSIYSRFGK